MTAPQDLTDERAAFEAWYSEDGKWPKAIERDENGSYILMSAANAWIAFQAGAALAGAAAAIPEGWKPIETAPKDGTRFLAVCATGQTRLVRWADFGGDKYPIADPAGTIWDDAPTHWMPLLAAPGAAAPLGIDKQGTIAIPPGDCTAPDCDCEPGWCRQRVPATFKAATPAQAVEEAGMEKFIDACLMARNWFEGDPDAALREIEHRAAALRAATNKTE